MSKCVDLTERLAFLVDTAFAPLGVSTFARLVSVGASDAALFVGPVTVGLISHVSSLDASAYFSAAFALASALGYALQRPRQPPDSPSRGGAGSAPPAAARVRQTRKHARLHEEEAEEVEAVEVQVEMRPRA